MVKPLTGADWVFDPDEVAALQKAGVITPDRKVLKNPNLAAPYGKSHFPTKTMIPLWTCSDGTEFSQEIDALRHELDVAHTALARRK